MSAIGLSELGPSDGSVSYSPSAVGLIELALPRFRSAPTTTILYPGEGETIYKTTVLAIAVTNFPDGASLEIQCEQGLVREVVHDGTDFHYPYLKSVRFAIAGGWSYQLRRTNGWVTSPNAIVRIFYND